MRTAILDIAGDALVLTIAEPTPGGWYRTIRRDRVVLRLARSARRPGGLSAGHRELAWETARRLVRGAATSGVDRLTGVVRTSAPNDRELLDGLARVAGRPLRRLTATDEADALLAATARSVPVPSHGGLALEVGGGTVRVALAGERGPSFAQSSPLDVDRLHAVDLHPASTGRSGEGAPDAILAPLAALVPAHAVVAGDVLAPAVRTIATWSQVVPIGRDANNVTLSGREVSAGLARLEALDPTRLLLEPGVDAADADRTRLGAIVLATLFRHLDLREVTFSAHGTGSGIVLRSIGVVDAPPTPAGTRARSVVDLVAAHAGPSAHAMATRRLAMTLFDALGEVHGLGAADRELLGHACLLHDIGRRLTDRGAHRAAAEAILASDLRGFAPRDVLLLAGVVRAQRGRAPGRHIAHWDALGREGQDRCARLAALLRVADGLDRGGEGAVSDVHVLTEPDAVVLHPQGRTDLDLAAYGVRSGRDLFEQVFGRSLIVHVPRSAAVRAVPAATPPAATDAGSPARVTPDAGARSAGG